jgi:hypothetical protein
MLRRLWLLLIHFFRLGFRALLLLIHVFHELLEIEIIRHATSRIDDFISFFNFGVIGEIREGSRILHNDLYFLHELRI